MPIPFTPAEKVRIQFKKGLTHGYVSNAQLDPMPSPQLEMLREADESIIVKVFAKSGALYWFTDRRIVLESDEKINELLRYSSVRHAHWMFSDLAQRFRDAARRSEESAITEMKLRHYDRIEVQAAGGSVSLEGLGQAYVPTLNFLQWLTTKVD